MKKFFKILMLVPGLYLLVIPFYFAGYSNTKPCSGIDICIEDSSDYHFVTRRQLWNMAYGSSVLGKPVKEIPVEDIEKKIRELRELREAEAYMSIDGTLHVYTEQRDPVCRILPDDGGDFFLDKEGIILRKRNLYTPRLHIVTGNVTISQAMLNGTSVFDTTIKNSVLKDIYHFVKYISDESFWSAQIDQIYVDSKNEINLIPRVGNQVIHLGTLENYRGKLRNLQAFYDQVLPESGWNRYSTINLEYKDQIVCRRR